MRLPRVRFTVRRVMTIVGASALLLGAGRMWQRHVAFRERAGLHAKEELRCYYFARRVAGIPFEEGEVGLLGVVHLSVLPDRTHLGFAYDRVTIGGDILGPDLHRTDHRLISSLVDQCEAMARWKAEYHAKLVRKYVHASNHPWLPVGPDPPEPK
jgi:hypothetical protein